MRKKLSLSTLFIIAMLLTVTSAPFRDKNSFIKGPYQCNILKEKKSFKKKFRDINTTGRFVIYKIELINKDSIDHLVDYSCFCLTDGNGSEYEVHSFATIVKQTEIEDINLLKDVDVYGFNNQFVKSNFKVNGWLIFEVPAVGKYQIKFRGYLK